MDHSAEMRSSSRNWFCAHLFSLATVLGWVAFAHNGDQVPAWLGWQFWIAVRIMLEMATLATWMFAALPPRFWLRWIDGATSALPLGAIFGVAAKLSGHYARDLWWLARSSTFWMVAIMMRGLGQNVVVNPVTSSIRTPTFSIEILDSCSGLEGITLMLGFVAIYLWWYRRELRFPHVLVLLPVSIALVWLFNAARIVALLMIGSFNGAAGIAGFHSVAGWLSLSIIGYGLVIASWRVPAFNRLGVGPAAPSRDNPAGFYLLPLWIIIAIAMVTKVFDPGFDSLYPLRVAAVAFALWFYRKDLAALGWSVSAWSAALGVLVFVIWIALAPAPDPHFNATFGADLKSLSLWALVAWLFFRIFGGVITVPIAEELAFRGYLMRKMIADDFRQVPIGSFTWLSFLGSSILFGAMHSEWVAGILAGMVFAFAVYRRGRLADAITAHATSNALLAMYVLPTHNWFLWT